MSLYECRRCGVLVNTNGSPDECPACDATNVRPGGDRTPFRRIDPDELF